MMGQHLQPQQIDESMEHVQQANGLAAPVANRHQTKFGNGCKCSFFVAGNRKNGAKPM
ncbi:hypothetical protein [Paracnuella aquatica]|uniref:hypothetical protein n=1 Tax=Paracnuella aquatica TaxID=2268757 RepID=UPI0012D7F3D8|nr:hypothetical protein [Paracnuella aquatica]